MLYKKMLRDIWEYKIQFISVFLMAFVGVFIFAGVGGEAHCLEVNIDNYYQETNLADGWIYASDIDKGFVDKVKDLDPTTGTERQLIVSSEGDFSNKPEIQLHFLENNTISKFYLAEGKEFNLSDKDGVWLDKNFADAKHLKVGDNITFKFNDMEIKKEIKGLGYSPEYVYSVPYYSVSPDYNEYGFAYMSHKAFPMDDIQYNALNVKFDGDSKHFEDSLDDKFKKKDYNSFLSRHDHSSVSEFQNMISQFKMMANILPLVFILVSMLMLLTSMKRIIAHQRTQIGILKANGFKNRSIMLHYLSYGFILVLAGSVLGLILGPIVLYKMSYPSLNDLFRLPYLHPVGGMSFSYLVVIMVLLSVIVSYLSIREIVNEHPTTIIRPKAPKATTSSFVEKLRVWKRLSFNIRWNYRDAKRNHFRAIMTIIGVLGCTVILISAFGLYDGMTDAEHWEFDKIDHFESKLVVDNDASASQIDDVNKDVGGDKIMESAIEIESDSTKKSATLLVLNDTDLVTPTDIHQNEIEIADDEVAISQKMADMLGVGVGDTVKWHLKDSDKWVKVKINKIYGNPSYQGLMMSPKKMDKLGVNYTATSILSSKHIDKDYDGIKSIIYRDDMIKSSRDLNEPLWLIIYALMSFAVILALIVLYNLGLLSFLEMERDIGTLKVLGFKTLSLTKLLLTQSLVFILIGGLIGIPLGYRVLAMIWASSSEKFYIIPVLTWTNLICTFLIIFVVSIIINIYFSRKIKHLDMVDALKILE